MKWNLDHYPTDLLEEIEHHLEAALEGSHKPSDDLLGWFGKPWAWGRLREVQRILNQRAWTTTQWRNSERNLKTSG